MDIDVGDIEGEVDEEELEGRLDALDWTETEYIEPHEYVYPENPEDPPVDEEALSLVRLIHILRQEDGYRQEFDGTEYLYYRVGDYRYWTCIVQDDVGNPPPNLLMNRAEVDSPDEGR